MRYLHHILTSHELGGAELIALNLADFFHAQAQECHVWIPGSGPAENKAKELGLSFHTYTTAGLFDSSRIKGAICNWKVGRALGRYSPGIIHIHSPFHYRALYPGIKLSRLKCVVHVHLEEKREGLQWAFKKPPDVIVTCAQFLVDYVRSTLPEHCQKDQPVIAVPNAVDIERFRPGEKTAAKVRVGARPGVPLVLMVANLAPHKGQETAIRAAASLKEAGTDALFWLAGTERGGKQEYTAHLRSLCDVLGVADRVCFLGYREDIPDLLRAADVFLLPSTAEGLPLSVLEAQVTKVPVLAAPTAGIPEVVIDGKTGFLIPAKDAEGYAHCIKKLLNDSFLYHRVTEEAYAKTVREYSWQAYGERIKELYQELTDTSRRCSFVR